MGGRALQGRYGIHAARLLRGAAALACLSACSLGAGSVRAQDASDLASEMASNVPSGTQMLLEADTLVYDTDANTVTAAGSVRIDYGGNRLVAQRVSYNRNTSRLVASGGVQIVESGGTKIFSDEIDITDDFADGFVNSLRVETLDKTYFAAESAERSGGVLTTFNNGVYTACAPCEEKPDRAPIWRIKARKIIWNGTSKTVGFEKSRFEFFGVPIAQVPYFEIADPTVKRKSGFLIPGVTFNSELGTGITVPYYLALSPTYDLTVKGTYYTKQGFLGEAEWRQRFDNGQYSIKIAAIRQREPGAFDDQNSVNSGTDIDPNRFRGMVGTKGRFELSPYWLFGWNVLAQTDKNFSHTYDIAGYRDYFHRSEIYLEGLKDRNYFDLRVMKFDVQEDVLDTSTAATNEEQPWVLPSMDYSYTPDEPVFGGELNLDVNLRALHRSDLADNELDDVQTVSADRIEGIEGTSSRLTGEGEWKRTFISDGGLMVTPLLAFQSDATFVDQSQASVDAIEMMAANPAINVPTDVRGDYFRAMATAGMEMRWPLLFSHGTSSHVFEPMAQVWARPDEAYGTTLGIPNEDAQSFVFDASTLFERDKFSGYDRIEGGTRANLGVRYNGVFGSGWTTNGLFGQSYQLAGLNSFTSPDLVNVGAFSGLETDTSDYVGLAGFSTPFGISASASARFDEQTFEVRRTVAKIGYSSSNFSATADYTFIQAQPLYGYSEDRTEITIGSSIRFAENWRAFGSGTYDFESGVLAKDSLGFAYDDECFSYSLTMATTRDVNRVTEDERTFGFNVAFRTLGDFGSSTGSE